MSFLPIKNQLDLISRGTEEILPADSLIQKLERSRKNSSPLIVKLGCDPSRPDLHIGHGVVLRKLRHFQDLGHQAVLVIGDFTAMIGDPTGRNKTRPQLTIDDAKRNSESYVDQAKLILDINKLRIVYNSEWLNQLSFSDIIKLAATTTVARMLERDDFTKRYKSKVPISLHEFLYPLAQAQDSVYLNADIELGGTDQKFNLLMGRDLQKAKGQDPQCIITLPLLEGTDGVEKMSKSYDNHIGLRDAPEEIYGKTLSISDDMIEKWFVLAADSDVEKIKNVKNQLENKRFNPMLLKRELAREIITLYYDKHIAQTAEEHFNTVVVGKGVPEDIPVFNLKNEILIVDLIFESGLLKSKGEARRMIKQGAVKLDGNSINNIYSMVSPGVEQILKIGKRRFLKILTK
tara:strand:- start:266 stop:1477 length:1212 start_codon:yes stop_codon:yes gene_type:complete